MAAFTRGSLSSKHAAVVQPPKDMPVRAVRFTLTRPAKRLSCSQKIRDVFIFVPPHALQPVRRLFSGGPFSVSNILRACKATAHAPAHAASYPRVPESSQISCPPASFDMASSRNMTSLGRSASICGRSLRAPPGLITRPFTWVYLALPGWSQAITTKPWEAKNSVKKI